MLSSMILRFMMATFLEVGQKFKNKSMMKIVTLEHLSRFENAYVLALLDCDKDINRIDNIRRKIPNIYQDRIFFLSSFDEAEHLKDDLGQGKKETIGYQLAQHCYDNDSSLWKVPMLNHNLPEIEKLKIKFKFFS